LVTCTAYSQCQRSIGHSQADAAGSAKDNEDVAAAEVNPPAAEVNPPTAEVNSPAIEVNVPVAEVYLPAAEVNPPAAEVNPPTAEVNSPTAEVSAAAVEAGGGKGIAAAAADTERRENVAMRCGTFGHTLTVLCLSYTNADVLTG
jgi:hypothetical protein